MAIHMTGDEPEFRVKPGTEWRLGRKGSAMAEIERLAMVRPSGKGGGPAFPTQGMMTDSEVYLPATGMSLRDYFAAQAMQAEIITSSSDATPESAQALVAAAEKAGRSPQRHLAHNAYEWADAMLAEREAATSSDERAGQ